MAFSYSLAQISRIVNGKLSGNGQTEITHLAYDSRRIQHPETALFFALQTVHGDGHGFVQEAYKKGVRNFVLSKPAKLENANIILAEEALQALQLLAAAHRQKFPIPVIGITGSNGKTIVKEWLNSLLEKEYQIARSPRSYNSQIGVPLSVWQLDERHTLGIFEAGISQPGEMAALEKVIHPTIGVLTNLGAAHSEGFASNDEKLSEKLQLFRNAEIVVGPAALLASVGTKKFTWSKEEGATLQLKAVQYSRESATLEAIYGGDAISLLIPFSDEASIENAMTCWCVLLHLGLEQATIQTRFADLHRIDMRLQLNHGINHCLLINDSYSADTTSLRIALDFLVQQSAGLKRTIILSDFFESGKTDAKLYGEIAHLLQHYGIQKVIAVGEAVSEHLPGELSPAIDVQLYSSTEDFIRRFKSSHFSKEIVLIKGARKANFERIAALFEQKQHGTVLQINLDALTHNLKAYQKILNPDTRIMAMVKAFSYGSGGAEIASVLQFNNVAYLGVAYADEGVELVRAGIQLPIMVMNAEPSSFAVIVEHELQPVIYSRSLLHTFEDYVKQQGLTAYPVHLEIETGMNRLGFAPEEIADTATHFKNGSYLQIQTVFTHLAASEEPSHDAFTHLQAEKFSAAIATLSSAIDYFFLTHIANSAAIVRHPQLQMNMVRLGIGLYGVEPDAEEKLDLQPVATLRATVAQVKELKKGESVSYNRRGVVDRDSRIATVRIGYADGYSRRFGNGVGKMLVRGKLAPVVGTVCMDMTMLDVTDIEGVNEGDDVLVFGKEIPVELAASWIQTIPYEVMTSVSQRVKRVYYYE